MTPDQQSTVSLTKRVASPDIVSPKTATPRFKANSPVHHLRQQEAVRQHYAAIRAKRIDAEYRGATLECMSTNERGLAAKMLLAEARRHQRNVPAVEHQQRYDITPMCTGKTLLTDIDILIAAPIVERAHRRSRKSSPTSAKTGKAAFPSREQVELEEKAPMAPLRPPVPPTSTIVPTFDGYHYVKAELAKLRIW